MGKKRLLPNLNEIGLVIVFDLVADITILLLCAACVIDVTYEKLENTLLGLVEQ